MASMTVRSPDVPEISPNISRSVADRSPSGRAGVPPMAPSPLLEELAPASADGCRNFFERAGPFPPNLGQIVRST